jgi:hypothetical protein
MLRGKLGLTRVNQVTSMLRKSVPLLILATFLMIGVTGCEKNNGEAVVLAKEHIDAALPTAETPRAQSEPAPNMEIRPMADDEITVDGYVMRPAVRGTSRHPRALKDEQWLVKVRMLDNGRTFRVPAAQSKWEKLRENDRVKLDIVQANTPEPYGTRTSNRIVIYSNSNRHPFDDTRGFGFAMGS